MQGKSKGRSVVLTWIGAHARIAAWIVTTGAALMLSLLSPGSSATSYPGNSPDFKFEIWQDNSFRVHSASRDGMHTYFFTATLDVPEGGPSIAADVYFGLNTPGNETVLTWKKAPEGFVLARGMTPVMRVENLHIPAKISVPDAQGASYKFSGHEKAGMYTVFALLVGAGTDPSNPSNWVAVRMEPLFVK